MIENWEQYKDLEFYPDRVCKCGCDGRIEVRLYHKKYGIPKYISGHNRAGRKKILREIRVCECGCKGVFECKVNSKQRFLYHHQKFPREIRVCVCGCEETFECRANSKQRYIYNHHGRNIPLSAEHKKKIGESHSDKSCKGRNKLPRVKRMCLGCAIEFIVSTGSDERKFHSGECYWSWMVGNWKDPEYVKMMIKAQHRKPNNFEKRVDKFLQEVLPGEYQINVKAEVMILAGKCPDFVNVNGQKKIIEANGDWWHGEKFTGRTKEEEEQQRIDCFAKEGYQTLIIWEHELKDMGKLETKLLNFSM